MKPDHPWGRSGNRDLFAELAARLGYSADFRGQLDVAFNHKSFANEALESIDHNERLEFLGDAVVDLVVAEHLMRNHPRMPEGQLSRHRAAIVSTKSLAAAAEELRLGEMLRLGRGEQRSGGRRKSSLLADVFEAVVGAVYLDLGMQKAENLLLDVFGERLRAATIVAEDADYKTALQEWTQSQLQSTPVYRVIGETGPDHQKVFHVEVSVQGRRLAQAKGRSKKLAERSAAHKALLNEQKVKTVSTTEGHVGDREERGSP